MLEKEIRNVTVFLHTATYNGNETIDHYNYRRGESKSFEIGKVETILKENAFDCYLFKDGNVLNKPKLLKIDVDVSNNKVSVFKKKIDDKPYSKICSYQEKPYDGSSRRDDGTERRWISSDDGKNNKY